MDAKISKIKLKQIRDLNVGHGFILSGRCFQRGYYHKSLNKYEVLCDDGFTADYLDGDYFVRPTNFKLDTQYPFYNFNK